MALRGGIDLGGTKIQTVVVDTTGEVRGQARHPTPQQGGPPAVAEAMAGALREAAEQAGVPTADLLGVGIGSPGSIDATSGTVTSARNLSEWEGSFALAPALAEQLGCPTALGNDVSVATLGEFHLGAGRPYRTLLGVFWGTGVGGGIILDGEPWHGVGAAGEIGHVVVKQGGRTCTCGRIGCLEAYAGRGAMELRARREHFEEGRKTKLFELMEDKGADRLKSSVWAKALEHGDDLAVDLIDHAVEALAVGIASAVNLLDVPAVIFGGGLGTRFGEPMADRVRAAMLPHLFNDHRPPAFHVAALGDLGGAVGASLLVGEPSAPSL